MAERGQFIKEYWDYKKRQGGQLSMKQYAALKKEQRESEALIVPGTVKKEN